MFAFVFFVFIAFASDDDKKDKVSPSAGVASNVNSMDDLKEKEWTKVYSFSGNGMKKSALFELTGNEARLKYSYKAPGGLGMGMFAVYVVDEGEDIMETGGIPEVMSQAENEASESTLQKSAGMYYLNVNASGNWTVTVEEFK